MKLQIDNYRISKLDDLILFLSNQDKNLNKRFENVKLT